MEINPAVAKLLELQPEAKAIPDFVKRLEALAKDQHWQRQFAECKKLSFLDWDEARAVLLRSGQNPYVVVLLKSWTRTIPGSDVQTAVLLDAQGKYLDHLGCEINSRLTRMHFGRLHTVIPDKPEADGAQLVIRLDGESARGNFSHHVFHGGGKADFYWGDEQLPLKQPTKYDTKGLCRIVIQRREIQGLVSA